MREEQKLLSEIHQELIRARAKFPGDNVTTLALMEEVGELATALFEEEANAVRKEAIQTAVMAMRVVLDGDATLRVWRIAKRLGPLTMNDLPNGAELIMLERLRQIEVEGWTPEHDDQHSDGEMALAAACYILANVDGKGAGMPSRWPWDAEWWKPKDQLSNLIRAGALIAAEIDRLQRAEANDA